MYAVIRTGGKQYTVQPGDVVQVEKLDQKLGAEFDIKEVLVLGGDTPTIGMPLVSNAAVTVVVTKQAMTRKLTVFKKKRRHSYRKMKTHRQEFTELFVKAITGPGVSAKAEGTPNVVDVAAQRVERIKTKQAEAKARRENKGAEDVKEEVKKAAKATRKPAKKAAAKKSGKGKTAKKAGAKKTAKKTTKK